MNKKDYITEVDFNKFNKNTVILQRLHTFKIEHGLDHVAALGGEQAVYEMLEADYDLAFAERVNCWETVRDKMLTLYAEKTPGLHASGFFDELFAQKKNLPAVA